MANQTLREWYNDPMNESIRYTPTIFKLLPDDGFQGHGVYSYFDILKVLALRNKSKLSYLLDWLDWYVISIDKHYPFNQFGFADALYITLKKPE